MVLDCVRMTDQKHQSEVLFEPAPGSWPGLVRAVPTDETARGTRKALGFVADRPVIMAGHQPGFWHPGILAKWVATHALAERVGGVGAWVAVDQSPGAGSEVAYPAHAAERSGGAAPVSPGHGGAALVRRAMKLGDSDTPPASQKPARLSPPTATALPAVAAGLARVAALLESHAGEPNLARQLHAACVEALGARLPLAPCWASGLHLTAGFGEMVGAMRADPAGCVRLYNEAAAARPDAGVRELAAGAAAVELPLWERSDAPGPWRTVTSDRLPDMPDDRLVLRGLPMTGLLRWRACDLFIHGTGGGASHAEEGYDRVTERWLESWLGAVDLAPAVVASATLRLDFRELARETPTPDDIARARELAHRASHDPALLGDVSLGARKRELAARIAALPKGSDERAALFAEMQRLGEQGRGDNAGQLAELRRRAEALAARAEEAEIVADRTWSWLFFPRAAIEDLCERIIAAIGNEGQRRDP